MANQTTNPDPDELALRLTKDDGSNFYLTHSEGTPEFYPTWEMPDGEVKKSWGMKEDSLWARLLRESMDGATVSTVNRSEVPEAEDDE